jgi:hypothetical protein
LIGLAAGGSIVALLPARTATADVPTIDVGQVKPGMKGYGLTVFQGTEPEKFDVEVIDVLHKFRPDQDLILVKTKHPRLEKVNVVAGMSGSPIFLNDGGTAKLAGAYAYGWSFGNEPVAGVTPIGNMLAEVKRPLLPILLSPKAKIPISAPLGKPIAKPAKKTGMIEELTPKGEKSATAWTGTPGTYSLEAHVKEIAARLGTGPGPNVGPQAVETPIIVGGLSDHTVKALATELAPLGLDVLQGGGAGVASTAKGAPEHFADGSAIAVQLLRGDSAAQGVGTVTHVMGKQLVGFGHPMMEVGSSAFPTAVAKILWVLSSDQRSFKIGEPVRELGTLIQDREPCIVVDEGITAPTIAMKIDIEGDPTAAKKTWSMEVVHDKFMSPMWTAFAFADAISTTMNDKKDASWTLQATIQIAGHGSLVVDDFGVSQGGVPQTALLVSRAGLAIGELMNNPWEDDLRIERVDAKVVVDWKRDAVRLRSAELLENTVDAGGTAHVKLTMKPFFGDEYSVVGAIKIDEALAGKDIEIEVVPGWSVFPDVASPESLDQLMHNLTVPTLSPKAFVLQYKTLEQGMALKGKVATKLPTFEIDALKSTSSTEVPESFQPMVRSSVDVGSYADGSTRLHLNVRVPLK